VEFQKSDTEIKGEGFFKKARSFEISYIILSPFYRDLLGLKDIYAIKDTHGYKVLRNDKLLIMGCTTNIRLINILNTDNADLLILTDIL